ncbi:Integral membrane protein TerC [Candidatus Glomeribacter gigasporarum BEG34]|uniref:Integral membrane protein TerC n=1 Tax=Candidatus Glomeribacter gigasporarum BEG34 TaxID=1070319 RepID=G2JBQ5_9BURK|nr:TerC family protein [Candidatus Glomeribacter gigasporarum]CCD30210.1 Integral membrane protein TerC [Candidatus Glomeribacter gigasporarum BEG34]
MSELIAGLNWGVIAQIIVIDVMLSGDNAIAIALACRDLPAAQRKQGIVWGTVGAIALRALLMFFALALFEWPGLKMAGGLLLLWIGIQLTAPRRNALHTVQSSKRLAAAIKTILLADFAMSLDNVLGIASASQAAHAKHRFLLIALGLLLSVPLMIWASQFLLKLLDRFPFIVTAGAALLGWIAGGLIIQDAILQRFPLLMTTAARIYAQIAGAVLVVALGALFARRRAR